MAAKKKSAKKKSNGIKWTAARRAAHGKKIAAARKRNATAKPLKWVNDAPLAPLNVRDRIRQAVNELVEQELRALLGK